MNQGYQALINHFTANDWNFERSDEDQVLQAGYTGENAQFRCAISVSEDDDVCQCFTVLPSVVPEDKRLLIAEVCIRASYGMKIGSFEFDMDDGEIRFHAAAPYPTGNLDDAVIRHLVSVSLHVPDRYYPAFMSVLFAGVSPNDAVFAVEQKLQDKLNARVSWGAG